MAGFATYAALRAAMDAGQLVEVSFVKGAAAQGAAWVNAWFTDGLPGAGTDPAGTPGTVYTSDAAAIAFDDRTGSKYVARIAVTGTCNTGSSQQSISVQFYDRLVAVGGIAVNSTGDKTVASSALTRFTDGFGVQAWLEAASTTSGTFALSMNSYTAQDGTTGRAGPSISVGSMGSRQLLPLPVQSGDLGVRAVATVNVSSAAAAGTVNVVLLKPIVTVVFPVGVNGSGATSDQDFFLERVAFPRIYDGTSLGMMLVVQNSQTSATLRGRVVMVYA